MGLPNSNRKLNTTAMISANEALERLKEGNRRFVSGTRSPETRMSQAQRKELAGGQEPFAVIIGCSDSRVPVELVFDQGLGDLFVIRVAGNIMTPSLIGSVEYAVANLGTRLAVVLGHTGCGAVQATVDELRQPTENPSKNLLSIVDRIRPAVEGLLDPEGKNDREELVRRSVRANVRVSTDALRQGSDILEPMIEEGELRVVGAEYSLETGEVDFFEGAGENG